MVADPVRDAKKHMESVYGIELPGLAIGPGWLHLVQHFLEEAKACGLLRDLRVLQIKEKFGELRIYYRCESDYPSCNYLRRRVRKITDASQGVCEVCGKPGAHRTRGSLHLTRCERCYASGLEA
mgnify:CR=1 FL=1